ncbi:MAG: exodeoxyribonuclease VII small subunit [Bacteroidales bacterium]|jgi:exodeoxyribonuclease VII small subunit|nr:exodeoxyribonuclease VII small subunit [Bacteroidales bacterium]MDD4703792.1 exodeoxyribonuclease VII small subunit [Bacteroidales bacterium]MDX9798056.1 exodeoxyribonuclease VII small subunit [Bacteroidales bacterium]
MEKKTYTEKFEELTKIVKELERGDIAIDEMTIKIQKALVLVEECKQTLTTINEDVSLIREKINNSYE